MAAGRQPQPADLRAGRQGSVGGGTAARSRRAHDGMAAAARRVWWNLHVSHGPRAGRPRVGGRTRRAPGGLRCAPAVAADQTPPVFPAVSRGGTTARVGGEDDSGGWLLEHSGPPVRRRSAHGGRLRRLRRCRVAEGDSLRDAVRRLSPPGRRSSRSRHRMGRLRDWPPTTGGSGRAIIVRDLRKTRNMRLAFKHGFALGGLENGMMTLTGGAFPGWRMAVHGGRRGTPRDRDRRSRSGRTTCSRSESSTPSSSQAMRLAIRFRRTCWSGPTFRPTSPIFIRICVRRASTSAPPKDLRVNPPNCIDCKATDVLGPRWTPREGGSGPKYRLM